MQLCTSWNNRSIPKLTMFTLCVFMQMLVAAQCQVHTGNNLSKSLPKSADGPTNHNYITLLPTRHLPHFAFCLAAPAAHTATTVSAATCSSHCSNQLTSPTCRITYRSPQPLCTQYTTAGWCNFYHRRS